MKKYKVGIFVLVGLSFVSVTHAFNFNSINPNLKGISASVNSNIVNKIATTSLSVRNTQMQNLAITNPLDFYNKAKKDNLFDTVTDTSQKNLVEKPVTVDGILNIGHADSITDGKKIPFYTISTDNGKTFKRFIPVSAIKDTGANSLKAQVSGYQLDNNIVGKIVSQSSNDAVSGKAPDVGNQYQGTQKELRLAIVLIRYKDSTKETVSAKQIQDMVFDGSDTPFKKFTEEQSYGKLTFSGDVYGWYTSTEKEPSVCPLGAYKNDIDKITGKNILDSYDIVYTILQCKGINSGSGVAYPNGIYGMGIVSNGDQLIGKWGNFPFKWTWIDRSLSHEIGHVLGIAQHSNDFDCGNSFPFLGNDCKYREYGNLFDQMGTGFYGNHFSAYIKYSLGWISDNDIVNINNSGIYSLKALELSGAQFAKIKIDQSSSYLIEYREPVGFDNGLKKGLYVNFLDYNKNMGLININPNSQGFGNYIENSQISGNQTYYDKINDITIGPITNTKQSSASFNVGMGNNYTCNKTIKNTKGKIKHTYLGKGQINPPYYDRLEISYDVLYNNLVDNSGRCIFDNLKIDIKYPDSLEPMNGIWLNSGMVVPNTSSDNNFITSVVVHPTISTARNSFMHFEGNFKPKNNLLKKGLYSFDITFTNVDTGKSFTKTLEYSTDPKYTGKTSN